LLLVPPQIWADVIELAPACRTGRASSDAATKRKPLGHPGSLPTESNTPKRTFYRSHRTESRLRHTRRPKISDNSDHTPGASGALTRTEALSGTDDVAEEAAGVRSPLSPCTLSHLTERAIQPNRSSAQRKAAAGRTEISRGLLNDHVRKCSTDLYSSASRRDLSRLPGFRFAFPLFVSREGGSTKTTASPVLGRHWLVFAWWELSSAREAS
jgi:hypothetical protein